MEKRPTTRILSGLEGPGKVEVRPAKNSENILVTIGRKRVVEYNFDSQQIIKSYFSASHVKLSTPLVYDEASQKLVCVVNKTNLLVWDGQETHLDKIKASNRLYSPAIDMFVHEQKITVLFENGDLQPLECLQKSFNAHNSSACKYKPMEIVKSKLVWHRGALHCAHILKNGVDLRQVSIEIGTNRFCQNHIKNVAMPQAKDIDIVGANVVSIEDDILCIRSFSDLGSNPQQQKLDKKPVAVSALSDNRVAVHCVNDQDGAAIQILDIKYSVVVKSINIKSSLAESLTVIDQETILFKQANNVVCWHLHKLPQGLSELIGTKQTTKNFQSSGDLKWTPLKMETSVISDISPSLLADQDLPPVLRLGLVESLLVNPGENLNEIRQFLAAPMSKTELYPFVKQTEFEAAKKVIGNIVKILPQVSPDDELFENLLICLESYLEAHYSTFVVSKEPQSVLLLEKALQLIADLDNSINLLATVMAHAKMAKKKLAVHQARQQNLQYSVEIIYF